MDDRFICICHDARERNKQGAVGAGRLYTSHYCIGWIWVIIMSRTNESDACVREEGLVDNGRGMVYVVCGVDIS